MSTTAPPLAVGPAHHRVRWATLAVPSAVALAASALVAAPATASPTPAASGSSAANAVVTWNAVAGDAALAACIAPLDNPLHESRMYAMAHLAVHDALNAIDARYRPYALTSGRALPDASPEAAVAAAARGVLVPVIGQIPEPFPAACLEAGAAVVEEAYGDALAEIPDGAAKDQGLRLGEAAAALVLADRTADGSDTPLIDPGFSQGTEPGQYRFTPGTPFAFAPGWGDVEPFALRRASQFGQQPPYRLTSRRYAADVAEVQALGGDGVTTPSARTPDQTQAAAFWQESSPLQWNRIGRTLATDGGLDLWDSARLFALLDAALADGYVASFDLKYRDLFWRPVTAIHEAGSDGNPATTPDPTWTPLRTTPPIPDHDSAHSVEGAAAAAVFRAVFGTDDMAFSTCSLTLAEGEQCDDASPVLRSFGSFSQAAAENGDSRVWIGFHFRHAVDVGLRHGDQIGRFTAARLLRPVR